MLVQINCFFFFLVEASEQRDWKPTFAKLRVGGRDRQIRLVPRRELVSPSAVVEHWHGTNLSQRHLSLPQCHTCQYRGTGTSRAAISSCSGLFGFVEDNGTIYFVEPIEEETKNTGEQLHVVYRRSPKQGEKHRCDSSEDWVNSWAEEIFRSLKASSSKVSRKQRSNVRELIPRYIEVCVVSDLKFILFHKSRNIEEYVLSIMNMVADIYHDASVGNLIDVVVVRLVFLHKEKEELDLDISPDAARTLEKFCQWQIGLNPKDSSHPNHHDIAVLLTRHDICSEGKASCGLLGLAYVGTVCNPSKNCCINEDTGLTLAATVAHELGHNMGCAHDSPEETGCEGKLPNGAGTVMAPSVGAVWSSTWSKCSKEFIANLLLNQLGECLLNEPNDLPFESPEMPIGAVYDADIQCEFVFGEDYIKCDIGGEKVCDELWCKKLGGKKCVSRGHTVADGTPCGPNKWCYGKECVPVGKRPEAVNGGWSEWGSWTACTRTCGGGVAMRERLCVNPKPQHGGRYCAGLKRDFTMCNTTDCPLGESTFREMQCSQHDTIPFKGQIFTWTPYPPPESDPNPCALYCLNDKRTLAKLEQRVKDGTRCYPGKKDTCIHGSCIRVGCDWGIESNAIEDVCGICNGDGTRCKLIKETFTNTLGNGYVKVATIPQGSVNIAIAELGNSDNMIAIGTKDGKIYFNKDFIEHFPGEYEVGGVPAVYSKPEKNREELHIKGPLLEEIALHYTFFTEENPGLEYKYSIPSDRPDHQPTYKWEFVDWGDCSARCGGGTQISKAACIEKQGGKVAEGYCDLSSRPEPKSRSCNPHKCRTRWKTWAWGACSGCMYHTGTRRRDVECVIELPTHSDGDEVIVAESECVGAKPVSVELCDSSRPCNATTCNRNKRWSEEFGAEFLQFSYNLTGVEKKIRNLYKRSSDHWFDFNCTNETVIIDKENPCDFALKTIDLSDTNTALLGNMSESDFESVGAMIPKFSAEDAVVLTGLDAMKKFDKLSHDKGVLQVDEEDEMQTPSRPTSTKITRPTEETTEIWDFTKRNKYFRSTFPCEY